MDDGPPLMPVRRLHNYLYCPRLFYFQWVEDVFLGNGDTQAGTNIHRKVDTPSHLREQDPELPERSNLRSIAVESPNLGLTGVVDFVETSEGERELLDYKHGSPWRDEHGQLIPKPNDAMQIAAYAMMLAEAGLPVERAFVYYAGERKRVPVPLGDEIFAGVRGTVAEANALANGGVCPPPLQDDSRCLACALYPVCLPHESRAWTNQQAIAGKIKEPPRPNADDGEILVVQNSRAYLGIRGGEVTVTLDGEAISRHPIEQLQAVYLYGAVQASAQLMHMLLERAIPLAWFSAAGRYLGMASGLPASGPDARRGQYRLFEDPNLRAKLTARIIRAKIHNQRVLLMRNGDAPDQALTRMACLRDQCETPAQSMDTLRGLEGAAAAIYFSHFGSMLKGTAFEQFDFNGRNRRPPKDPVNALLSQGYSILAKELTGICHAVGLDPFLGFLHQPRYGRPALALDLMEEFRPIIADSVVISVLNRRELEPSDFTHTTKGVFMNDSGRKQFWRAWFRRMDTEVSHPEFGYKMPYRRMLDVQTRQFWRFCRGEAPDYHPFTTR